MITTSPKTITIPQDMAKDRKLLEKINQKYGSFSEFVTKKLEEEKGE